MSYSRVARHASKKQTYKQVTFGLLSVVLVAGFTTQAVNTDSYITVFGEEKTVEKFEIATLETGLSMTIEATNSVSTETHSVASGMTKLGKTIISYEQENPTHTDVSESISQVTSYGNYETAHTNMAQTTSASAAGVTGTLANGNTAGVIGTEAAAKMAEATGVPQSTWEYIIARESNGDPNVANASGASGLFQTMPGWGSTATVEDQINAALNAYNSQGLSAWAVQ